MKLLVISLLTICIVNLSAASVTKIIKAETQLYAGRSTDVVTNLEIELRREAIKACGSAYNISGLTDYKIKIGLMVDLVLDIDFNSLDYSGAFIWSNNYPNGKAMAKVICKK